MAFPTTVQLKQGMEKDETSSQKHKLGTRGVTSDGRVFYYAENSGTAIDHGGYLVDGIAAVGAHDMDLAATATSAGATSFTSGTSLTVTKDQYKDGYLYVNDGTGEGHIYKIRQHDAIDSSGSGAINLYDGDAIATGFVAATIAGLAKNPYKDFIVYPTTSTGHAVGVAATDFDDDDFGWLQTWGPAAVLCDVAFVIGNHVRVSDGTAGSGEPLDRDGTHENEEVIGVASVIAPVTTDYGFVNLTINP